MPLNLIVSVILSAAPLQAGQKCVCVADGMPTWVLELMVHKPTVREAITFVKQIGDSLDVPIV